MRLHAVAHFVGHVVLAEPQRRRGLAHLADLPQQAVPEPRGIVAELAQFRRQEAEARVDHHVAADRVAVVVEPLRGGEVLLPVARPAPVGPVDGAGGAVEEALEHRARPGAVGRLGQQRGGRGETPKGEGPLLLLDVYRGVGNRLPGSVENLDGQIRHAVLLDASLGLLPPGGVGLHPRPHQPGRRGACPDPRPGPGPAPPDRPDRRPVAAAPGERRPAGSRPRSPGPPRPPPILPHLAPQARRWCPPANTRRAVELQAERGEPDARPGRLGRPYPATKSGPCRPF